MVDPGIVDRLEGALIALRSSGMPVRQQAETLLAVMVESGWSPASDVIELAGGDLERLTAPMLAGLEDRLRLEDVLPEIMAPVQKAADDLLRAIDALPDDSPAPALAGLEDRLRAQAREVEVDALLDAFVGAGEPGSSAGYTLRPRRHADRWGWSFSDADGKGADCRLFCDATGTAQWTWYPGSPAGDPELHCWTCGERPDAHLLVAEGMSACSIVEGDGHLGGGRCECDATSLEPVPSIFGGPACPRCGSDTCPGRGELARCTMTVVTDERAPERRLGEALHRGELCDLNMPHNVGKRAPIGCPPNCPARAAVPTIEGVMPFIDRAGVFHSPLCAIVERTPTNTALGELSCDCASIIIAGKGVAYDPSRCLRIPGTAD